MKKTLRCSYCGVVIGEHESMIVLRDAGKVREAIKASASTDSVAASECYHRHCYAHAYSQLRPVDG